MTTCLSCGKADLRCEYEKIVLLGVFVFKTNGRPPSSVSAMATTHSDYSVKDGASQTEV